MRSLLTLSLLGLVIAMAPLAQADDAVKKVPDAKKILKKVEKALKKETAKSGFKVNCSVRGGVSMTKDHSLSSTSVAQDFNTDVHKAIMYLASMDAYRTPSKGALRNEKNVWKDALADKNGVLFMRLMNYPHLLLESAKKNAAKVEWVWVGDELVEEESEVEEEETEGHTSVAKRKEAQKGWKGTPHVLKVTLTGKESLEKFNEAMDSNCVGGGWGVSAFMSRVDKTVTNGVYLIDFDTKTNLPKSIKLTLTTGVKGDGKEAGAQKKELKDGMEHVAFHFNYTINSYGTVEPLAIPKDAQKILK